MAMVSGRGEDVGVAGPRVVGVAVGDDGSVHDAGRVDAEVARLAVEAAAGGFQPEGGVGGHGGFIAAGGEFGARGVTGFGLSRMCLNFMFSSLMSLGVR